MALKITLDGFILTVVEEIYSFFGTRRSYWYYNISTWMVSSTGKKDAPIDRPMSKESIAWVEKYYLPKVRGATY